ncbi:unnamed protein product [Echinostoma caproni]|uniref:Ubiquitin-like domain-containing protein n=1 Tax=Echinostoma caproni TaxID=27848 RepID=A0A183APP4_9TREM|nr:unnamed protein product [Echinostoma caproni]
MRVDVHLPDGQVFILDVDPSGHVSQIDEQLEARLGQLPIGTRYYHKHHQLNNSKRLTDCHIEDGAVIYMSCPLIRGCPYFSYDEICNHK